MRELIGKFNRERGDTFNDDVADLFRAYPSLIVDCYVKKFHGKRLQGNLGDLGDIDVLVIDQDNKHLLLIECKDLAGARTPSELKNELDIIFKGGENQNSTIVKHGQRVKWVVENLDLVLSHYGMELSRGWKIIPFLVVDEAIFSSHIYPSPIKVISYRIISENVLPSWDKTQEWDLK